MENFGVYLKGSTFLLLEAKTYFEARALLLDLEEQDRRDNCFIKNSYEIRRV